MKNPFSIALSLLFLVVFNALFFWLVDTSNAPTSVWISYGFITLAYLTILALPYLGPKGGPDGWFLNATMYSIVVPYFLLELVIGIVFIVMRPESYTAALLVQALMWVLFLVWFLAQAASNKVIADNHKERMAANQAQRDMVGQMKMLMSIVKDPTLKATLLRHHDVLRYSATRQTPATEPIDIELEAAISSLRGLVRSGEESTEEAKRLTTLIGNLVLERKEAAKTNQNNM